MQALQIIISGIAQGCIYGLIALGVVLIYKATEAVDHNTYVAAPVASHVPSAPMNCICVDAMREPSRTT